MTPEAIRSKAAAARKRLGRLVARVENKRAPRSELGLVKYAAKHGAKNIETDFSILREGEAAAKHPIKRQRLDRKAISEAEKRLKAEAGLISRQARIQRRKKDPVAARYHFWAGLIFNLCLAVLVCITVARWIGVV